MQSKNAITIEGQVGLCGNRKVFLGFAPAKVLHSVSFADVLNEDTGEGYQRPFDRDHSSDFQRYITLPGSSTIPLTFNLRDDLSHLWQIRKRKSGTATLFIRSGRPCLAQVDCQHRLGELRVSEIPLAFMAFIGLDLRAEMAMFFVINSKARGLSSSLTDYHQSNLLADLAEEAPHLYIARRLNEDQASAWYKLIRYGGEATSGLKRRTSLRMMQASIRDFLRQTREVDLGSIDDKYALVCSYWRAVREAFKEQWDDHRHHLITKGVGLYSLTLLLTHIVIRTGTATTSESEFRTMLSQLRGKVSWHSNGMFANAGGRKGANEVYTVLKGTMNL